MKKKIFLFIVLLILIAISALFVSYTGLFVFTFNSEEFTLTSQIEMEKSIYKLNGSWWGYNQTKLASIGDTTFSFNYDNSNYKNGNPSLTNPYKCDFIMINNGSIESFGYGFSERPGNVLTDTQRNKVYYFLVEPTGVNEGNNGNSGVARTMMYIYDFDPLTKEVTFVSKEEIIAPSSVGKIREGAYIDESGNIAIAYGQYDGILKVHTYDVENEIWNVNQILTNNDNDSLMYAYVVMEDLDNFYVLCVQDTTTTDLTYYQYVKLFAYNNGVWTDYMVVDYRDEPIANKETNLVEHTELCLLNDTLHLITRSDKLSEIKHFTFENNQLVEQETSYLNKDYKWIRLIEIDNEIYYVANTDTLFSTIDIIRLSSKKKVFSTTIAKDSYIYINTHNSDGQVQVLTYPSSKLFYEYCKARLYYINKK